MNSESQNPLARPILWGIFLLYGIVLAFSITHHELWGDELHSWNIAKASGSFFDLIDNTRYEGHPPVWYTFLWALSKFTHRVEYIQLVQFLIACLVVFLVIFYSPFPLVAKALIPFGYFFLFEYGVISRNYAIAVLFVFCLCIVVHKNFKYKQAIYYSLLFLLSNTHLLALLFAVSFHLYFLLIIRRNEKFRAGIFLHGLVGLLLLLPSAYFIFPPPDSSLGTDYWLQRWNISQLSVIVKAPLRAFIPIPAWWNYHFWNTEFLVDARPRFGVLKAVNLLVSVVILSLAIIVLKKQRNALVLFLTFLVSMFIASTILPFANARQVGFIYIGFLAALWAHCYYRPLSNFQKQAVSSFLILQLLAAEFAVLKDMRFPFSNANRVQELLKEVPDHDKIVTDYWCLNTLSAFTDKPYYCVDLQREASYLQWNSEVKAMLNTPNRYANGIDNVLRQSSIDHVYMITIHSPEKMVQLDNRLMDSFNVRLVDKREGAIEKGSDLYLYQIAND